MSYNEGDIGWRTWYAESNLKALISVWGAEDDQMFAQTVFLIKARMKMTTYKKVLLTAHWLRLEVVIAFNHTRVMMWFMTTMAKIFSTEIRVMIWSMAVNPTTGCTAVKGMTCCKETLTLMYSTSQRVLIVWWISRPMRATWLPFVRVLPIRSRLRV